MSRRSGARWVIDRGSRTARHRAVVLAGGLAAGVAFALGSGAGGVAAQVLPSTSSTETIAPPPPTTTTTTTATTVPETTTTTEVPTTSTAVPETTTSGAPRTTTTVPRETSSTFVPPAGHSSTSTIPVAAARSLDADTDKLPLFVSLSLGGFLVAFAIVGAQWIRTRR